MSPGSPEDPVGAAAVVLAERTGLRLPAGSRVILRDALAERAAERCGGDLRRYATDLTRDDRHEVDALFDLVAVGQTQFYRQPATFGALLDHVIPALARRCEPIHLVSAGCSTGEEAWTLAACAAAAAGPSVPFEVTAVDWSRRSLALAEEARYPAASVEALPDPLRRHFEVHEGVALPSETLRQRVRFVRRNLSHLRPGDLGGDVDVILFCNVGIYFDRAVVERGLAAFHDALSPGGYLFLGHAESLWGLRHPFELVDVGNVFAYRRGASQEPPSMPLPARSEVAATVAPEVPLTRVARASSAAEPRMASGEAEADADAAVRELVAAAQEALIRGRLDLAEEAASALEGADAFNPDAQFVKATVAERRGAHDEAAAAFRRALYLDPSFALAHFGQAQSCERCGDLRRAAAGYQAAARNLVAEPERYDGYLESLRVSALAAACAAKAQTLGAAALPADV